jgi:serine protease Do
MERGKSFHVPTFTRCMTLVLILSTSLIRLLIALGLHRGTWIASGEFLLGIVFAFAYMANQRWGKRWLVGLALFNLLYFALRGVIHGELFLALYEAIVSLLIVGALLGKPSRLRAAGCLGGYLLILGGITVLTVMLAHRAHPAHEVIGSARAATRYKSDYLYEVGFEGLPWRMLTAEQTERLLGTRVDEADLRLVREDGSSFALFFPLSFNNIAYSPELGLELEDEIREKWLTGLDNWQQAGQEQGFILTAEGAAGETPLSYVVLYKHFGNFGLYAVFWSEGHHGARLLAEAETFYTRLSAPPLKERLTRLTATQIYERNSDAVVLINVYDQEENLVGRGTGFNLSPEGIVVTNLHVFSEGDIIEVVFPRDGFYRQVSIAGLSRADADLALLFLSGSALPTVRAIRSVDVVPGDTVFVIGNPRGLVNSLSEGIVGGIREERELTLYQITAPISQGSSGGPVFNEYGEVIGIASALIEDAQNLNFSVAIDELKHLLLLPQPLSLSEFHTLLEENSHSE